MSKRGQITIFIIIGILLVLIIGGIFFIKIRNQKAKETLEAEKVKDFASQTQTFESYTKQCIEDFSLLTLKYFGTIGSNPNAELGYFTYENQGSAYLREDTNLQLPSIETWEVTLQNLFTQSLNSCSFNVFEEQGLTIEKEQPEIKVDISEQKVDFKIDWPIKITQEDSTKEFKSFFVSHPIKLGYIHNAIQQILEEELANPGFIPSSTLLKFDLDIITLNPTSNTIIYIMQDDDYFFVFADKELVEVVE